MTVFAHSETTNKLVNEAANDSARGSGQDRKITPGSRNQSDCRVWRIPPARKLGKKKKCYPQNKQIRMPNKINYPKLHLQNKMDPKRMRSR